LVENGEVLADDLLCLVALCAPNVPLLIQHEDGVVFNSFHQEPEALFTLFERLLGFLGLGHVPGNALDRHQLARLIVDGLVALLGPDHPPILAKRADGEGDFRVAQHLLEEMLVVRVSYLEPQLGIGVVLLKRVADDGSD
jgi:hypothetical protein